jgi:hypothetical protein
VATLKRILVAIGVALGALIYVWIAAVRAVPTVKRRKEVLRRRRYGAGERG